MKQRGEIYYPAFLDLMDKRVIVIGGGRVAERKIIALLKTGAVTTVISPTLTKRIEREKERRKLKHIRRKYKKGDLKYAFLVIAATDSITTNEKVSKEAPFLVNIVDTPQLCNFIVPSIVDRWPLTIAISTNGISPALSKSIRKELEKLYGPSFSDYLKVVKNIRLRAMSLIHDKKRREEFLKDFASEKMIRVLREKGLKEARKIVFDLCKRAKITY